MYRVRHVASKVPAQAEGDPPQRGGTVNVDGKTVRFQPLRERPTAEQTVYADAVPLPAVKTAERFHERFCAAVVQAFYDVGDYHTRLPFLPPD
jgi:hypothetical protein